MKMNSTYKFLKKYLLGLLGLILVYPAIGQTFDFSQWSWSNSFAAEDGYYSIETTGQQCVLLKDPSGNYYKLDGSLFSINIGTGVDGYVKNDYWYSGSDGNFPRVCFIVKSNCYVYLSGTTIYVVKDPPVFASVSGASISASAFCSGSATLTASAIVENPADGYPKYEWYNSSNTLLATTTINTYDVSSTGTYYVKVYAVAGISATSSSVSVSGPSPSLSATATRSAMVLQQLPLRQRIIVPLQDILTIIFTTQPTICS